MKKSRQIFHLFRINRVLVRHGLDEIIFKIHFLRPIRFFYYLIPSYWLRKKDKPLGARIRTCLEELGPVFVKFGQILSTRRDLLPDEIADELVKLQDQVPPFPGKKAKALIEAAYNQPIEEIFDDFEIQPLASASIAQVHTARLKTGEEIIIKVIRPEIEPIIKRDLDLMFFIASLAERFWKDGKRLRPLEIVSEFKTVIYDELDLIREAANASQLRRNFENNDLLYVPIIYWDLVKRNVMVMERIHGTPVSDLETLKAKNIDIAQLAAHGVEIFYTQVFKHNFFHADMHPGNIFVADDGQYIAIDFGIMGSLSEDDQHYLAQNFIAFFDQDYKKVAELHIESGWVPASTRVDELESAIRSVCEPNFNRPLKEISFGQVLLRLFETARRFDMEVQPQLVLLQKTLLNIEGLGRQLYPDLDLWQTAKPFLKGWMNEQFGFRKFVSRVKHDLPKAIDKLPDLPFLLHDYLDKAIQGKLVVQTKSEDINKLRKEIKASRNKIINAIIASSALLISALLFINQGSNQFFSTAAWGFGIAGFILLFMSNNK